MSDDARQPVAIRIARPYTSEDAFLENELDTLTRTSVVLVGAQSRPQGVVLRFEVTLASGAPLLRGEGRVVAYKPTAYNNEPGLTLRFTRLDPRSKALVDRAAALRDARARAGRAPHPNLLQGAPPLASSSGSLPVEPPSVTPLPEAEASSQRPMRPLASTWADEEPSSTTMTYDAPTLTRLKESQELQQAILDDSPPPSSPGSSHDPDTGITAIGERTPAPTVEIPVAEVSSIDVDVDVDLDGDTGEPSPQPSGDFEPATPDAVPERTSNVARPGLPAPPAMPEFPGRTATSPAPPAPRARPTPPQPRPSAAPPVARPSSLPPAPPRAPSAAPTAPPPEASAPEGSRVTAAPPPAARSDLLERLRSRARDLPTARRDAILAAKRPRPEQ